MDTALCYFEVHGPCKPLVQAFENPLAFEALWIFAWDLALLTPPPSQPFLPLLPHLPPLDHHIALLDFGYSTPRHNQILFPPQDRPFLQVCSYHRQSPTPQLILFSSWLFSSLPRAHREQTRRAHHLLHRQVFALLQGERFCCHRRALPQCTEILFLLPEMAHSHLEGPLPSECWSATKPGRRHGLCPLNPGSSVHIAFRHPVHQPIWRSLQPNSDRETFQSKRKSNSLATMQPVPHKAPKWQQIWGRCTLRAGQHLTIPMGRARFLGRVSVAGLTDAGKQAASHTWKKKFLFQP